ncbi:MAG: Ubiquitin-conjugating enzyme E2 11 [Chrysothrix sp. TS-e1954]|nr:MAG: Ubiquitin-conjugating enzyme E2 11 [Chrysothrix sp. TS-e1954]
MPILDNTPHDTPRDTPDILPNPPTNTKPTISVTQSASSTANVTKRLQSELTTLLLSPPPGISAFPTSESTLLHWTATLAGPAETPYTNLTFKLSLEFPANYPYAAPEVKFTTPIYHPNVDFSGRICLDILKEKWSASLSVSAVLLSLQSLLGEPNNASPLNGQAAELWDSDKVEFQRLVLARHVEPLDEPGQF